MDITRRQAILLILTVIVGLGAFVALDQLVERVSPWDYDDFERWMRDLGALGPIVYIIFFALSMVIAPIPTTPAPIAAAAAWGAAAGAIYTLIAGAIGASLCFYIARRWGRRAYEHFLPEKMVLEIDRLADRLAVRVLLVMRLFPMLGPDVVSYAAGLTTIRYRDYLLITVIFSLPSVILISVIGENVREDRTVAAVGLGVLAAFLILPLLYFVVRKRRSAPALASGESAPAEAGPSDEA
jgi:uncharacterized membrane protein YdjX (TVP38/TMEM64 family)